MIPEVSGDFSDDAMQCGCPYDGKNCPHCGRNVLYNGRLVNRHMPRCHNAAVRSTAPAPPTPQ